uniref:Orf77 n=1 Tax=Picobiliphyte sp. MS584-11 TaxID=1157699 RepID=A0A2H4R897_9EUKA|nr:orf77 [Picobiliphyte sp. MS584-11]
MWIIDTCWSRKSLKGITIYWLDSSLYYPRMWVMLRSSYYQLYVGSPMWICKHVNILHITHVCKLVAKPLRSITYIRG